MLIHGSVSFFILILLQRNDKREVDNTQKIYLIDAALENLSHVTDDYSNALFLFIEKANSQQGKQNYRNSYLKHRAYQQIRIFFFRLFVA